jgi:UDP-glucose 4-epimerase
MRILVSGGAGFIGSHIVDHYVNAGHKVTVVDNLSSGSRKNLNPAAKFVKADVRSPKLKALFKSGKFDVVNHHAAQIDVRKSVENPAFDAEVNVMGLLNLLELSRRNKVCKFIFSASGGTFYGECGAPAPETTYPNPMSPYGVTKLAGEYYVRTYGALHGLRYTVLRYANVYGPRQDPHGEAGVVAIFSNRILDGGTVTIFGDGEQVRDFVYVDDVARANVLALAKGDNDSFNIGTGQTTSVNELYAAFQRVTGYGKKAVLKPARPGEIMRSVVAIQKAQAALAWGPAYSLSEGLEETFAFFKDLREGERRKARGER